LQDELSYCELLIYDYNPECTIHGKSLIHHANEIQRRILINKGSIC